MTRKLTIFSVDVVDNNRDITVKLFPAEQGAATVDSIVVAPITATTTNGRVDLDVIPTSKIQRGVQYVLQIEGFRSWQFDMPDADTNFGDLIRTGEFTVPANNTGLETLEVVSAGLREQGIIQQGQVLGWQADRDGINKLVVSDVSGSIQQLVSQGTTLPSTTGVGRLFLLTRDEGNNKRGLYWSYQVDSWELYSDLDKLENWAFKDNDDVIPLQKLGRETIITREAGAFTDAGTKNIVVRQNARTLSFKQSNDPFFDDTDNLKGNTLSLTFAGYSHEILTARNYEQHNGEDFTTITVGVDLPELTTGTTYQFGVIKPEYTAVQDLKLKGIEDGAEQNVQADWNTTDTTDDSYIENKPDIVQRNNVAPYLNSLTGNNRVDYDSLKNTPTNADIKRDYENNPNTNNFNDASKNKLDLLNVRDITNITIGANKIITISYTDGSGGAQSKATGALSFLTLEEIQDAVDNMVRVGGNISKNYDDNAGTLTLTGTIQNWFKGAWTSGTSYIAGDIVHYNNNVYIAQNAVSGSTTPDNDTTNWLSFSLEAGLSIVHTDNTITGTGTSTDPLKVAIPFTQAEKTKLDGIETGAHQNTGLEFTQADHDKLDGIADNAEVNVNADWDATTGDAEILNKPDITAPNIASQLNNLTGADRVDYGSLQNTPTPLTNARIKEQYEANDDTNPFTDADATKLDNSITTLREGTGITISGTGEARTITATGGGTGGTTPAQPQDSTELLDIADTTEDFSLRSDQEQKDTIPSPQWDYETQIGNAVRQVNTNITSTRFSDDNLTSLLASIEYTQYPGGETEAGKLTITFPTGTTLQDLWNNGAFTHINISGGTIGAGGFDIPISRDRSIQGTIAFEGTPFPDAAAEGSDSEASTLWRATADVPAGRYTINFKSGDDVLFKADTQPEPKQLKRSGLVDLIKKEAPTPTQRTFSEIFAGTRSMTTSLVNSLIDSNTDILRVDTAFTSDLTYTAAPAGDPAVAGDVWTGDDTSNINVSFALGGHTWTIQRIVDDTDSGHIIMRLSNFTDAQFEVLKNYKVRFTADGQVYTFANNAFITDYVAANDTREIEWDRRGDRLTVGTHTIDIFEPITSDNLVPGGASANEYLGTDENGTPIWKTDNSANRIQVLHDGGIVGLNITAINGTKGDQNAISGNFRIHSQQTHGVFNGEIELTRQSGAPTTTDFGGDNTSAIITITNLSVDRVLNSAPYNFSTGDYGAHVNDAVEVYDGETLQGKIDAYINRDAQGAIGLLLLYTPASTAGSGNMVIGATLQLRFEPFGVLLQHAIEAGRMYVYQNALPTLDSSFNIETLGTPLALVLTGAQKDLYYGRATHTDTGTTDTGYSRVPVNLDATQFEAGVSGTKSYRGVNKHSSRNFQGVSVPAGGTLSTPNDNILALMLTYDTVGGGNGRLTALFATNRTYTGTINISAGSATIQLSRVSDTLWQSGTLGRYTVTALNDFSQWSVTAEADIVRTTTYDWVALGFADSSGGGGGLTTSQVNALIATHTGNANAHHTPTPAPQTATTARAGIVELATLTEAAGNAGDRAITPAGLTSVLSTHRSTTPSPVHHTIPNTVNLSLGSTTGEWSTNYTEIWRFTNSSTTATRKFHLKVNINARASWTATGGGDRAGMDVRTRVMNSNGSEAEVLQDHNDIYIRTGQSPYHLLSRYGHTNVDEDVELAPGQYVLIEGIGAAQARNSTQSPTPTIQIETDRFNATTQEYF